MYTFRTLTDADLLRILYADGYGGSSLIEELCRRLDEATNSDEIFEMQCDNDRLEGENEELKSDVRKLNQTLDLMENELLHMKESHQKEVSALREMIRDAISGYSGYRILVLEKPPCT